MSLFPGPPELGRGIVVLAEDPVPSEAASWPRFVLDEASVSKPRPLAEVLHAHWLARTPFVLELRADPEILREAERCELPPYEVDAAHDFARERLQYLVWSNNYDARSTRGVDPGRQPGEPIWWHGRRAQRLGAKPSERADALFPDGSHAWCDGGPRGPVGDTAGEGLAICHRESLESGQLLLDRAAPAAAELAPDQLAAVAHGSGPARIIAPAGSGKTRVLTERLRHLLLDRGVTPGTVTAVAYNKRAADELLERTAPLRAHIRTLNSLGLAIVNGSAPFADPGGSRRRVIDEPEVRQILQSLVPVRRQLNTDPWIPYLEALSAIRLGLTPPEVVEETYPDAAGIAGAFDSYRLVLAEQNLVDFDEQIYLAIELLLSRPDLRRRAQRCARHLLVDEFQDLTPAHLLMLRLLAAPTYDVFGVGDDDQVIYSYAGASPEFLIGYDRYFPGAKTYALEVNYRCSPTVVDAAGTLLGYNRRRVDKVVVPAPGRAVDPTALRVESRPAELQAAASSALIHAWAKRGAPWAEIAVLARVNSALLPLQVSLMEEGVPCTAPLGAEILSRTGIRSALAYLRIGSSPELIKKADVAETIRRPSRKIARNVAEMLLARSTISISDIAKLAGALSGGDVEKLESYADDLELVAATVASGTTAEALRVIRTRVGLGSAMDALDSAKRELDRSTHLDDLAALEQVAGLNPDPSGFEGWLRQMLSRRGSEDGVTLSTVHRVKGREWPHVLVIGAAADAFPHRLAGDIEEERRVFHVAITRSSIDVVVMADSARPSRFCSELTVTAPAPAAEPPPSAGSRVSEPPRRAASRVPVSKFEGPVEESRQRLSKALRDWRTATASRGKVPAYVVLSDAYLEGIAATSPRSLGDLARCRGIGPAKLEKYGDDILAVIDGVEGSDLVGSACGGAGASGAEQS